MIQRKPASPSTSASSSANNNITRLHAATKLFVLDTNVLMHDPTSLFRFEEHDLFIPMATLEELDDHKKGMSEVSRNARQASRYLDELIGHTAADIMKGIALSTHGDKSANGRLFFQLDVFRS